MDIDKHLQTSANREAKTTQHQQEKALDMGGPQHTSQAPSPNASPQSSEAYWVRTAYSMNELDQKKCLIRFRDGAVVHEALFTLEAQKHDGIPDYHAISGRRSVEFGTGGTSHVIVFDQHRADQIKRAVPPTDGDFEFMVDIDMARPPQHIPCGREAVYQHLEEAWKALDEEHGSLMQQ